jgi:hypothetical protein
LEIKVFKLTLKEVIENAWKAYQEGKLTAQHPDPAKRRCVNNGDEDYRCAVAVSYPKDYKVEGSFFRLFKCGEIGCDDVYEAISIQRIQDSHDVWAALSRSGVDEKAILLAKWIFVGQLTYYQTTGTVDLYYKLGEEVKEFLSFN